MNSIKEQEHIILSASRMTDMPKFYPEILIEEVNKRMERSLCGCSMSTDIGGFPPKICGTGCLYCYGNASR